MKQDDESFYDKSDEETNQSCPALIEEDITKSKNSTVMREAKSQQLVTTTRNRFAEMDRKDIKKEFGIEEKPTSEYEKQIERINKVKVGTDFDCEKVQSLELQDDYYIDLSGPRTKKSSQSQLEPGSAKKNKIFKEQERQNSYKRKHQQVKVDVLNVLVAGAEDTGKTTFIRCFKNKKKQKDEPFIRERTKQLKQQRRSNDQNIVNQRNYVNFFDLPGFSEYEQDIYAAKIEQIVANGFQSYKKNPNQDKRVHCCLYFLRGPRVKQSDIRMVKILSQLFSLIPIIAKSDSYTVEQILQIKKVFNKIVNEQRIHVFGVEEIVRLRLAEEKKIQYLNSRFGALSPFAIASSEEVDTFDPKGFTRKYPWGRVEIQNQEHTQFIKLVKLLTEVINKDLISYTRQKKSRRQFQPDKQQSQLMGMIADEQTIVQNKKANPKNKRVIKSLILAMVGCALWHFRGEITNILKNHS